MNAIRNLMLLAAGLAGACDRGGDDGLTAAPHGGGEHPAIDFAEQPGYLPDNVLVLTFDDGPDWNNTAKVLDVLAERQVKATFFINTKNWANVDDEPPMQDLVRRMVEEGHELANHSVGHLHLPTLDADALEAEIAGVEQTVATIFGASAPRLTLFRAPFGEPYQTGEGYDAVAPIVAEHAVHIGWAIDTYDYNCTTGDAACVVGNFTAALEAGAYGVVLMHSVQPHTADALPEILDYIEEHGYELWTTEQVVCAAFGTSSAHLVDGTDGGCEPDDDGGGGDDGGGDVDGGVGDDDSGDGGDGGGDNAGDDDADEPMAGCGCAGTTGGAPTAGLLALVLLVARRRRR
jgi:uncharacterized protein (TIGR03382 family)